MGRISFYKSRFLWYEHFCCTMKSLQSQYAKVQLWQYIPAFPLLKVRQKLTELSYEGKHRSDLNYLLRIAFQSILS